MMLWVHPLLSQEAVRLPQLLKLMVEMPSNAMLVLGERIFLFAKRLAARRPHLAFVSKPEFHCRVVRTIVFWTAQKYHPSRNVHITASKFDTIAKGHASRVVGAHRCLEYIIDTGDNAGASGKI
jgi:hypothetical protein